MNIKHTFLKYVFFCTLAFEKKGKNASENYQFENLIYCILWNSI